MRNTPTVTMVTETKTRLRMAYGRNIITTIAGVWYVS